MMHLAQGFLFSGVHTGVKQTKPDLALIYSDAPCVAAGCLTTNSVRAAPILHAAAMLPAANVHGLLINSGIANALTGPFGRVDLETVLQGLGQALSKPVESLLCASTGMIGLRLPVAKIKAALPKLVANLEKSPDRAAQAILTTDTGTKMASRCISLDGQPVVLTAICKGSGMVAPQLATMIAAISTDCAISPDCLHVALTQAVATSFNALTVDGDMSTNDAVFVLANGAAQNVQVTGPGEHFDLFAQALADLCKEMARSIAADGEGATRLMEVTVSGAPSQDAALELARSVAASSLVKAALFGGDPSWARVLTSVGAKAGTRGWAVLPEHCRVSIQRTVMYDKAPIEVDLAKLKVSMREPEILIEVDVGMGQSSATAWGCDLSYEYVKINADYSASLSQSPSGAVVRDARLSNYTPKLKAALLLEALGYIGAFAGQRCVIKYGGSAMHQEAQKASFCRDVLMLVKAGLKVVVVHGGGPEIDRHLGALGQTPEFVDGQRVTAPGDLDIIEMVLTGRINTELVTLMNAEGQMAVGLSGKDGGLIRAMRLVDEQGRSLGQVGEVTRVNTALLDVLLEHGHVPVVSPIGLGEDGLTYNINADAVAAHVACAIGAKKLIYLTDVAGILADGQLQPKLCANDLNGQLQAGGIAGGMKAKAQSILRALRGGVDDVHIIDGRMAHSLIAELFTDDGIGTLVQR